MRLTLVALTFLFSCLCSINFHIFVARKTQPLALPLRRPRDMCHYHTRDYRMTLAMPISTSSFDWTSNFDCIAQLATAPTLCVCLGNSIGKNCETRSLKCGSNTQLSCNYKCNRNCCYDDILPGVATKRSSVCVECASYRSVCVR